MDHEAIPKLSASAETTGERIAIILSLSDFLIEPVLESPNVVDNLTTGNLLTIHPYGHEFSTSRQQAPAACHF